MVLHLEILKCTFPPAPQHGHRWISLCRSAAIFLDFSYCQKETFVRAEQFHGPAFALADEGDGGGCLCRTREWMLSKWLLASFLCCGSTAKNHCHNKPWVFWSFLLEGSRTEKTSLRVGKTRLFSLPVFSWERAVSPRIPKKPSSTMGIFSEMCSPQPALLVRLSPCLPLSLPAPAQSARIIPIYLLPWLYITIYHLSSLCCPPPRYLHCLSPWHASLSPFSLRCRLILLRISLEIPPPPSIMAV